MMIIEFRTINVDDWSTSYLTDWEIYHPEKHFFPRIGELIMLPKTQHSTEQKRYKITKILHVNLDKVIYYVVTSDDNSVMLKFDDEVLSDIVKSKKRI